ERGWEYKQICVTRVPGYGFGIAVSGGRDNPHFASGDPSIAVSDVLASGPAERLLQVNDRIISVNGISLQNVDYATAVQVLRDSGDTVTLVIKRRTIQHSHTHSSSFNGPPLAALGSNSLSTKVTLTKNSKKEGKESILLCHLRLIYLTACVNHPVSEFHPIYNWRSISGDDFLTSGHQSYSNQNLYVQPPTRNPNLNQNGGFEDKLDQSSGPNSLPDEKSNLAPRGRSRGPLSEANLNQLENRNSIAGYGLLKGRDDPPRPPPPRAEDYYSSRRQMYEDDPIIQKTKQPIPDARFITFHKEGSVGIRLTGGNFAGIFVTAVQPGSPASLQGLQPGDKILKVNDMDMTGVTREEAVLFLLSLQDRIELIVQFCKEEYDSIVASQKGDSFYIKTHFHYESPAKGEMPFRSGDIFHVIDTLYNGVVGCWQVFRIGRNNQEVQKGIIPNKSRAEELATAQFNATKKEMSANESRGSFFKRRRSSNRRSKSLGKEHWDDLLFSDTVSKFPAYERVILKHPGFTRPVIMFGPIADVARDKLLKDFPDKFISPRKFSNKLYDFNQGPLGPRGGVERLNYAQMYPIVVFFKAETKIVIKQLRQGLPKKGQDFFSEISFPTIYLQPRIAPRTNSLPHRHRHSRSRSRKSALSMYNSPQFIHRTSPFTSSYYPPENSSILSRISSQNSILPESHQNPEESLSDDFLFPMSSLRLSYASSPESDLEHSPGPPTSPSLTGNGNPGRLTKASSDPSVVMPDSSTNDVLPPYQPSYDARYGFNNQEQQQPPSDPQLTPTDSPLVKEAPFALSNPDIPSGIDPQSPYGKTQNFNDKVPMYTSESYQKPDYPKIPDPRHDLYAAPERKSDYNGDKSMQHKRQASTLHGVYNHSKGHSIAEQSPAKDGVYGQVPDLPPRVDRAAKPGMGLLTTSNKIPNGRSAHERLFGTKATTHGENVDPNANENGNFNNKAGSLERSQNSKSDSLSSYDSYNKQATTRIGPNAHDDLKTTLSKIDTTGAIPTIQNSPSKYNMGPRWDQNSHRLGSKMDLKYVLPPGEHLDNSPRNSREMSKDSPMDPASPRGSVERDIYRYSKSPAKQNITGKTMVETKTDYGKYSRNNSHPHQPPPEYTRTSHQDLRESTLSIHQQSPLRSPPVHHNGYDPGVQNHMGPPNGNTYKPVPPPKPKNYKPPYKAQGGYGGEIREGIIQSPPVYQHGKSHSNPVDHRNQNINLSPHHNHNYYYNTPPHHNFHPADPNMQYPPGPNRSHYDMAPPYQESPRRHTSISYASRSEITPIAQHHDGTYGDVMETRPPIVDLQGSREQRGSAFELYRKPVGHNLRGMVERPAFYGSQPNIAQKLNTSTSSATNSPKITPKLTKTQSFKHQKSEGFTPKLFRKLSFTRKSRESTPKMSKKFSLQPPESIDENRILQDINRNARDMRPSKRDVTSSMVGHSGATLVNEYWGVSLEVPPGAIPKGEERLIYFVISDPRLCENAPPLDLDNGETMLSPLVMCGPQGTEFLKPVILNIPHYANTLPSLGISLKATDSEQDIHIDWDNILLPSNHAANSVAVKVDHF
uniref:Tight junction protein ZO-1 n=1 Tax=Diabrotica virgifera virgifera TaxID=50390 RepID=A0A6P7GE89_DIAVI